MALLRAGSRSRFALTPFATLAALSLSASFTARALGPFRALGTSTSATELVLLRGFLTRSGRLARLVSVFALAYTLYVAARTLLRLT